jgi:cysteine desulfurase/selenocysteine lyase
MMSALVSKSDFLGLDGVAYLAAGGETPFLKSHLDAVRWFAEQKSSGMPGREAFIARSEGARSKLAALMGCQAGDIGFGFNVAQAMNLVVDSLNLQPGDNIVLERWEFPSLLYPMLQQRERGVEVRLLEPENGRWLAPLERVRRAVDRGTKAIAISQVSYFTGERHDLEAYGKIAHDAGALLLVDCTHALGAVPVHAPHADFMFSACYKWILGTHGVAVAYWNRERLPNWRPWLIGWTSVEWQNAQQRGGPFELVNDAHIFEMGNASYIGTTILDNALDYLNAVGIERIERHVLALSGRLRQGLVDAGVEVMTPEPAAQRAGNVAFEVGDERAWRAGLEARGVLTWVSDSRVRMSTHLYNDEDDVDRAIAAVQALKAEIGVRAAVSSSR